jgi:hypothetical protein
MRKAIAAAILLLVGSAALGATVFRTQIAGAAQPPQPVREVNTDANGNIKVHEQGTATVSVDSSSTNPVSTINVNDGQNLYSDNGFAALPMGLAGADASGSFTVPSGQRAVIEQVGVKIRVPTGAAVQSVGVIADPGRTYLVPVKTGSDGTNDWYAASEQVRLYLDAGSPVSIEVDTSTLAANGTVAFFVGGYLVHAS